MLFNLKFLFWANISIALVNLAFHFSMKGSIPWYISVLAVVNFSVAGFIYYVTNKIKNNKKDNGGNL